MMIVQDFSYAVRLLSKKPGFTLLTTLVMATGMGLSLFLLSFLNTMAFKDLPFKDGNSFVLLSTYQLGVVDYGQEINLHDYQEIRTSLNGMSEFGAYNSISVNVSGRDGAKRYSAISAEANIFKITRTTPILGREFSEAENQSGAEYVVVIGYDIWQNQFAGDEQVLGQVLRINGQSHRIIGVMPEGYFFPARAEMWLPMREDATKLPRGKSSSFYGMGHLEKGVSIEDINVQLEVIMKRLEAKYPKTNGGSRAYASTLQNSQGNRDESDIIYGMYIVAILILILAAVNVGNLLLSRAVERSKETAIRMALGAPRSRLISQMLWESIIICSLGGLIGLLVVAWGLEIMETIVATFTFDKPVFWWKFGLDSFTMKLFFTFTFCSILVTGLLPAWKNTGGDFNSTLRDGTRGALGKKTGKLNRLLVMAEIFISMVILIVAGVMLVSSYLTTHADIGADTKDILTARVLLTQASYDTPEKQVSFAKTLQSRLENSPGISDVMISSALPGFWSPTPPIALEGKEYSKEGDNTYPRANYIVVTPGSLAKIGIELKQGRYFTSSDDGLDNNTVIVTDSFVASHFPDQSPLGKRLKLVEADGETPKWLTIVGVVEHTSQGPANEPRGKFSSIFRPYAQAPRQQMTIAMRMNADSAVITRTLRKTLQSIDPELPAFRIEPYAAAIARSIAPMQFISTVFLLFGIAALILASSGIYGVMSNTISQRTQEIGVKRALGADEEHITREFLKTGLKQLLAGAIPGLISGCAMGFAMSQLMGVGNANLLLIGVIMMTLIGTVVVLATYIPTKRALKMEPSQALHHE